MSRHLILWPLVIVIVAAAIVDDILIRRTLNRRPAPTDPNDPSRKSGNDGDRAMFFGANGNERILGVLQSLYRFP